MKWKIIGKYILFFVIILILGCSLYKGFLYKDMGGGGGWQHFYASSRNSIDVMVFGSSHAHCTVDNAYLWDKYGIASYTLSAGGQPIDGTYYFMKEALKTQKPKVMLVEMLMLNEGLTWDIKNVYRDYMGMKWSFDYFRAIKEIGKRNDYSSEFQNELLLKIPIFHSRYKEVTKEDFVDNIPFLKGYIGSYDCAPFEIPDACENTEIGELSEETELYLNKIVELSSAENIPLIFFASPFILDDEKQRTFNAAALFAEENNIPFINFNSIYDEINFNYETDMREGTHVNNSGADKITAYLGEILKEKYEVPDRKGDAKYDDWNLNSRYIFSFKEWQYRLAGCGDIHGYIQELSAMDADNIIVLSLDGNYGALGDVYTEDMETLGIDRQAYEEGGAWLIKNGNIEAILQKRKGNIAKEKLNKKELILARHTEQDEEGQEIEKADIVIDGEDCKTVENGVNIMVYDPVLQMVVDKAGVNVYEGLSIVRPEE